MELRRGTRASVIAATAYYMTAAHSRSDPVARWHLWSLAADDDSRLQDAHDYCDGQVDSSDDPSRDLRALDLIDDTLRDLRTRQADT